MGRKKYTKRDDTPEVLRFREKRKWQIALRRYVIEHQPSSAYAPYFGLDIQNMRQWFEYQFKNGLDWENFGAKWQFDHIVPVTFFDFKNENDLRMCWNFINLRVEPFQLNKDRGNRLDVLGAKSYFEELYKNTGYEPCKKILKKIDEIEISGFVSSEEQQKFIREHWEYLKLIEGYTDFEFHLLNQGRSIEDVKKEAEFLRSFNKSI